MEGKVPGKVRGRGEGSRGDGEGRGGGGGVLPDLTLPRGTRVKVSKVLEFDLLKCLVSPRGANASLPSPFTPHPVPSPYILYQESSLSISFLTSSLSLLYFT